MPPLNVEDLSGVELTYLGVLSLGLVSADLAHDTRFRMEYVCAVAHALVRGEARERYLTGGGEQHEAAPNFREALRHAIIDLDRKGVIGIGPPEELAILKPTAPDLDAVYGEVDINRHPPIFDRFLSQRCMDLLMDNEPAHAWLMELYAESGDVWAELYKQGYGNYR